jgi:CHAD domain-containing protein
MAKSRSAQVERELGVGNGGRPAAHKAAVGVAAARAGAVAGKAVAEQASARPDRRAKREFSLVADETVPDGVRRIARAQIESAIELLRGNGDREAAVHETRKSMKRTRTVLRLARGDLDPGIYGFENHSLRDIARRLAVARDSQVMVETLESVSKRFSGEIAPEQLEGLRSRLVTEHEDAEQQLEGDQELLDSAIRQLEAARARVPGWTLAHEDFRALAPGLRRIHRRGRRAFKEARREPSAENLHELRKRAKDLWYATQILRHAAPSRLKKVRRGAHKLSDLLGEDHDLALLRTTALKHRRELADPAALAALLGVIDRRRAQVQRQALGRADRLYATKPKALVRSIRRRWRKRMGGAEAVAA